MKILYVVSRPLTINTSATIRNIATILGFKSLGHTVEVVTTEADRHHPAYDETIHLPDINIKEIKLSGLQSFIKIGHKLKLLSPLRMFLYRFMEKKEVYDNLKSIVNHTNEIDLSACRYDFIISSSDPKSSHLFVYKLLKENPNFKGKWIQIWGDPFASDITNNINNTKLIKEEEVKLLSKATKVVYVSNLTLIDQQKRYPDYAWKMMFLPIPYIETTLYPDNRLNDKRTIELVYCGDYNSSVRNILPLVQVVQNSTRLHLTLCGNTDKAILPTGSITVYGRSDYSMVRNLESHADILVHLSNIKGTQIPGKIYHYSSTNKPILFILDGDVNGILSQFEQYKRYEFCLNTPDSITNKIQHLLVSDKQFKPVEAFRNVTICSNIIDC